MMQEDLSKLHQELADVKQLLQQVAQEQLLARSQQPLGSAQEPAASLQQQGCSCGNEVSGGDEGRETGAKSQTPPRPRTSVHLDLPKDDQRSTDSSDASTQQLPLQPQQLAQHPLLLLGQGLKPSISDAVMLQRAVHAAQIQAPVHSSPVKAAGLDSSQSSLRQGADTHQDSARQSAACQERNCLEQCSVPSTCDAAVHVSATSNSSKQQKLEGQEQQPAGQWPGAWQGAAGGGRELDMLAKRVHSDMDAGNSQLQPIEQCWARAPRLSCVLKPIFVLFWDIVMPGDYFALAWDLLMLLVILYLCIALPYTVAFAIDFTDLTHPMARLDLAASSLFMFDCWMNFRAAYVGDDGCVVTKRSKIAVNYMSGWFVFDLVSSLPYEQMLHESNHGIPSIVALLKVPRVLRLVKVLRLLKVLRMARLTKLPSLMPKVEWLLNRPTTQMAIMCGACCMMLHWIACAWYYTAMAAEDGGWVAANSLDNSPDGERYVTALYFAVSTVATVGFGDIVALTVREKVVALITMLMGASIFGYFMGAISVMVSASSSSRARMTAKRRAVDDFLTHRRVPRALADKVKRYVDYVVEREVQADEADIISGLSANLRTQVVLHLYQEALEKVPFFRGQHPQFITSLVTALQLEYYAPGDTVVWQGEMGDAMFFLAQGSLEVRLYETDSPSQHPQHKHSPDTPAVQEQQQQQQQQQADKPGDNGWLVRLLRTRHRLSAQQTEGDAQQSSSSWALEDELANRPYRHLGYLHPGEYFGEYSCLLGQERSATVVASSYVELYSLNRTDLEVVLQQWPELAEQFEAMVQEAAGGLGVEQHPHVTPAVCSSPLTRWNMAKAACQQQACSSSVETEPQQPLQHGYDPAAAAHVSVQQQQADSSQVQPQPPPPPQQQSPWSHVAANQAGSSGGPLQLRRLSLNSCSGPMGPGPASPHAVVGIPGSPRYRSHPGSHLTALHPARSSPIAIAGASQSPAAAAAAAAAHEDLTHFTLQQQQTQLGQVPHTVGPGNDNGRLARRSLVGDASLADPAVMDFPSLAARSISMVSNMSGVSPTPPAAAPGRHRRSGSLTRGSLPPASALGISSSGHDALARVSVSVARQGSGLFRTISGQRYLFRGLQARSSVLLGPQPEAAEDQQGPGAPEDQQRAWCSSSTQWPGAPSACHSPRCPGLGSSTGSTQRQYAASVGHSVSS